MSWSYRLVERNFQGNADVYYEFIEAYYNDNEEIENYVYTDIILHEKGDIDWFCDKLKEAVKAKKLLKQDKILGQK